MSLPPPANLPSTASNSFSVYMKKEMEEWRGGIEGQINNLICFNTLLTMQEAYQEKGEIHGALSFFCSLEFYKIWFLFIVHGRMHPTPEQLLGRNKQKGQFEEYSQVSKGRMAISVSHSFSFWRMNRITECCEGLVWVLDKLNLLFILSFHSFPGLSCWHTWYLMKTSEHLQNLQHISQHNILIFRSNQGQSNSRHKSPGFEQIIN